MFAIRFDIGDAVIIHFNLFLNCFLIRIYPSTFKKSGAKSTFKKVEQNSILVLPFLKVNVEQNSILVLPFLKVKVFIFFHLFTFDTN